MNTPARRTRSLALLTTLLLAASLLWLAGHTLAAPPATAAAAEAAATTPYQIVITDTGATIEQRFYHHNFHFMTLVDENGTINLRPHPGPDINGWGSSWYAQPFFPKTILAGAQATAVPHTTGITVTATGPVVDGTPDGNGTFGLTLDLAYDPAGRTISGSGLYTVSLDSQASDLNLYKIASNYLDDVPLLVSGGMGDTGDMTAVHVSGSGPHFTWIPPVQPGHFPADLYQTLTVTVQGDYNEVDTAVQGYPPIAPAFKPTLAVGLTATSANHRLKFGAIYVADEAQQFWSDNVGITPLLANPSPLALTMHVTFRAQAIETSTHLPLIARP